MEDYKAQVISGGFGEIVLRQKSGFELELGELLVSKSGEGKVLLQVTDLYYGSQVSQINLEKISGVELEEGAKASFVNNKLRNYTLAKAKALLVVKNGKVFSAKSLPPFFSGLRSVEEEDLKFLSSGESELFLGYLRSGTKKLDLKVGLDGEKVLSHHILITGTTGKGKSVLMKNLIWNSTGNGYASMLVFDPHDEYYGRKGFGLKDHPSKKILYYTSRDVPAGQRSLKVSLALLRPDHFDFMDMTSPQRQVMYLYYKKHGASWIEKLLVDDDSMGDLMGKEINEMSLAVTRRKLKILLELEILGDKLECNGIFDKSSGTGTVADIVNALENGKTVIVDTSNFSGNAELLVASLISTEVFNKYKYYNSKGALEGKPVVNIVLEEAPRVIGRDVLERGPNIFSGVAREGRKFRIGLSAITQLPSLIPKEVLANMNTKIILGTEMNTERQAIIESASQDLSSDNRSIASLDKGEAIVSSNFARFALPLSIPFFDVEARKEAENRRGIPKNSFMGLKKSVVSPE